MSKTIEQLSADWMRHKSAEELATVERRKIEDQIVKMLEIPENFESTETTEPAGFQIKISGRIDRKIDSEKLQMLASENGLSVHLATLFRWKPELNMALWKASSEAITKPLAGAITAKPGRPSFKIIIKD
jgi:hypothetical protein